MKAHRGGGAAPTKKPTQLKRGLKRHADGTVAHTDHPISAEPLPQNSRNLALRGKCEIYFVLSYLLDKYMEYK